MLSAGGPGVLVCRAVMMEIMENVVLLYLLVLCRTASNFNQFIHVMIKNVLHHY